MDVGLLHSLGWHHTIELEQGIRMTWETACDTLGFAATNMAGA
jgi:nucleoside-diphosphate-sugar epimerase